MRFTIFLLFISIQAFGQTLDKNVSENTSSQIIIYGSDTCHYCIETKAFLKEHKISFYYYDIDTNKEKLNEMLGKMTQAGISTVNVQLPVVHKNSELFMNDSEFEEFLQRLILKK